MSSTEEFTGTEKNADVSILPEVFLISGGLAVLLLTVFTIVLFFRRKISSTCKHWVAAFCVLSLTSYAAGVLVYFASTIKLVTLAVGDQLILGVDATADFNICLYRAFCRSIMIETDRPGLFVWTVSIAPHIISNVSYGLLIRSDQALVIVPLRLSVADEIRISQTESSLRWAVYQNEYNWNEWRSAGEQQSAHELCCAWWPQQSARDQIISVEKAGLHRIVLRRNENDLNSHSNAPSEILQIHVRRSKYHATECDPLVCDGRERQCRVISLDKVTILDYQIRSGSEKEFDLISASISCQRKEWAFVLLVSIIPIASFIIFCICFQKMNKKGMKANERLDKMRKGDICKEIHLSRDGEMHKSIEVDYV